MPNYTVVDEARDLIKPYVDTGDSAQESLTRSTVGWTGKNKLDNPNVGTYTQGGITITTNADKSFSTSAGTPSENVNGYLLSSGVVYPAGEYIISGFPANTGISESAAFVELKDTGWAQSVQIAKLTSANLEQKFTLAQDTALYIRPYLVSGNSLPAMTFKLMIRPASIKDSTYEPYHASVADLVGDIQEVIPSEASSSNKLVTASDAAEKVDKDTYYANEPINLAPNEAVTTEDHGVVFTVNPDKTIIANGTATNGNATLMLSSTVSLPAGNYVMSGTPDGGSNVKYFIGAQIGSYVENWNGKSAFTVSSDVTNGDWFIVVSEGITVNNLEFKPMITSPSYTGDYVPYAMTNRQLTENIVVPFDKNRREEPVVLSNGDTEVIFNKNCNVVIWVPSGVIAVCANNHQFGQADNIIESGYSGRQIAKFTAKAGEMYVIRITAGTGDGAFYRVWY